MINKKSKIIKAKAGKRLGTYLAELTLPDIPYFKNEKEMPGKLKEEKHSHQESKTFTANE